MITLLGTAHVFDLRHRLQREVMARAPDVVCLELDAPRFQGLMARKRGDARASPAPLAYRLLAGFQERMASERGVEPGDEMLAAYEAAEQGKVPVALIDMDAQAAFRRLWQGMGLFEKARFLGSALATALLPGWLLDKEVEKLQGDYSAMMEELGREFPTVKRVLIDERNEHMASRLLALRAQGKERIVAVVGDGHVDGMRAILDVRAPGEVEVVRLKDLQQAEPQGTASYGFTTSTAWQGP